MPTRWRMPPDSSCGNARARAAALGMRTFSSIDTAWFQASRHGSARWARIASTIWSPIV